MFQEKQIRKVLHEGEWWFVIVEVILALTDSADPSDYMKKMRKRDPKLSEIFKGGGQFVPSLALEFTTAGENFKKLIARKENRLQGGKD